MGSIVRTAAAFGVESVWLCGNTPDLDLPAVGKTALGTERFLSAYRTPSPVAAVKEAAEDGFRVIAVELASGAVPLFEAPLDGDVCLAIGNEDHGCSPALLSAVHGVAYIPQVGRVGSLNVAVAAAIALAEARRREWTAPGRLEAIVFAPRATRAITGVYRACLVGGDTRGVAAEYLDHPRPLAFAHRGGAAQQPENILAAFESRGAARVRLPGDRRAVDRGRQADRLPRRATSTGPPTGPGRSASCRWREVSAARVNGTEPIPLLEDLLGAFPELRFNIDLKDAGHHRAAGRGAQAHRGLGPGLPHARSPARRLLAAQRSLDRPVCLAVTPAAIAAVRYLGFPASALARRLARSGALCAQVPPQIATRGVHQPGARCSASQVHVWTLNTRAEIERALDLGADGVMTDEVVLLRDILAERGQWHPRVLTRPSEHLAPVNC